MITTRAAQRLRAYARGREAIEPGSTWAATVSGLDNRFPWASNWSIGFGVMIVVVDFGQVVYQSVDRAAA